MDIEHLRTFRLLAVNLNFSRTALMLDYAQSSISAQIRSLEKELGAPLFHRSGRRVQLTDAGRRLQTYADRMLALNDEARNALTGPREQEDVLCIGAPESVLTYILPTVLRQFQQAFPKVRLVYKPMVDNELYEGITTHRLDFAFLLQPPVQVKHLEVTPLAEVPLHVIAPLGHRLTKARKVRPRDVEGETVILTETGCGYRYLFEQELTKTGNYGYVKLEFSSVEAIKRCVSAGLGLGFLPGFAVGREVKARELCLLDWERRFNVQLQLVRHQQTWLSPVGEQFVEFCGGITASIGHGK
jgi:DNA-binding transcriptional LysR family regulator